MVEEKRVPRICGLETCSHFLTPPNLHSNEDAICNYSDTPILVMKGKECEYGLVETIPGERQINEELEFSEPQNNPYKKTYIPGKYGVD